MINHLHSLINCVKKFISYILFFDHAKPYHVTNSYSKSLVTKILKINLYKSDPYLTYAP